MSKSDIPQKTRYLLWAKTAGRCELTGCNEPLWKDNLSQIEMNFAQVAHIIGDSPFGPRGHPKLSQEYCDDIENLMLLCPRHHHMVDENPDIYPDDVLREMKQIHEIRIEQSTGIIPDKSSTLIFFIAKIGAFQPNINLHDALQAMFPDWLPASQLPINLSLSNLELDDSSEDYWKIESQNLEQRFKHLVEPILSNPLGRNHFSIFAFAPQPLLIKLGTLIPDIYPGEVYQLHREPSNWKWQDGPKGFNYKISEPRTNFSNVVLNLSLSATIKSNRIEKCIGNSDYSEWQMTISSPNNDFLKSKEQLKLFRQKLRELFNQIKAKHGNDVVIHLFPAVPISIAVEIGRVWQPKSDLPMIIYDQNAKKEGFIKTITIGEK
ncbi:HNH endonuclease [Pelolinea submarina]|uniref:HNH endonuclease n=1 Tax=Pelolinea submarina TaxID=913107 RepID=A0A347ZQ30_9CHLR|nr:HNH endonuclease [Pelolinea submarina]REG06260.1 HNH endonuclease [Pelolinea submarina]BBB47411.1 hypothetical protein Pelsub_P0638 [Pelolinea submarina]